MKLTDNKDLMELEQLMLEKAEIDHKIKLNLSNKADFYQKSAEETK